MNKKISNSVTKIIIPILGFIFFATFTTPIIVQATSIENPSEIVNTCPLPSSTVGESTDTTVEVVQNVANGEPILQTIIDTTNPGLDVEDDQEQYQEWNSSLSQEILVSPKFLSKNSAANSVFGYYKDGDINTFVPIFKTGSVDPSDTLGNAAPLATDSSQIFSTVSTGATKIGFALKSWIGSSYIISATQNNLSTGGLDRTVAYNPSSNTYILAFEDYTDWDYNDVVVEISLSCTQIPNETPQACSISSDTNTQITQIAIGDNSPTVVNTDAVLVSSTNITDMFWTADVDGSLTAAKWIWSENPVQDWLVSKVVTFTRSFNVTDAGTSATITLASDNTYTLYLDDVEISANNSTTYFTTTGNTISIPSLSIGEHTLKFVVTNLGQEGEAINNPGGLLYHLVLHNESCDDTDNPPDGENDAPTISLVGSNTLTFTIGQTFVDPGATANDNEDGGSFYYPATTAEFTVLNPVPSGILTTAGTYTITYQYTDSDGATSPIISRIVNIIPGSTECSDGTDNDGDGFADIQDPDCHTDRNNNHPETYDSSDNNEDASTIVDVCLNIAGNQTEVPSGSQVSQGICTPIVTNEDQPNDNSDENGGDTQIARSGGNRRGGGGGTITPSTGLVLGASTECGLYLTDYIKAGKKNNPEEVIKLQGFLNELLGTNLPLDGIYNKKTIAAVNTFQLKYSDEILEPWIKIGLHKSLYSPTGYVYRTTQRKINELVCPALNLPIPDLKDEKVGR